MNIQFAFNPECSDGVWNCSGNDPCYSRPKSASHHHQPFFPFFLVLGVAAVLFGGVFSVGVVSMGFWGFFWGCVFVNFCFVLGFVFGLFFFFTPLF